MKLTEEETIKFCELYRENECLWNMCLPSYKNKMIRQKAFEAIVTEMGLPGFGVVEVKNKIKCIRSTFNQECLKIKKSTKSGAGTEDIYTPSIKWFDVLQPVMQSKGASSVISNFDNEDNSLLTTEPAADESPNSLPLLLQPTSPPDTLNVSNSAKKTPAAPRGNKRKFSELSSIVKDLRAASVSLSQPEKEESEFDIFGKYVGSSLSKMPPLESLQAQQEIQETLTKFRIKLLSSKKESTPQSNNKLFVVENISDYGNLVEIDDESN